MTAANGSKKAMVPAVSLDLNNVVVLPVDVYRAMLAAIEGGEADRERALTQPDTDQQQVNKEIHRHDQCTFEAIDIAFRYCLGALLKTESVLLITIAAYIAADTESPGVSTGVPVDRLAERLGCDRRTVERALEAQRECPQVRLLKFRRNCGQSAAMDAGIRHGRADHLPDTVTTAKSGQPAHLGEIPFSDLDAEISRLAAVSGPAAAFRQLASPDLRFYRDRALPVIGRDRSLALLPAAPAAWTWRAEGQAGSADGSLGYSYGILETQAAAGGARPALQHSYLHIWRRGGDGYRLVLDLAVAIPVAPAS